MLFLLKYGNMNKEGKKGYLMNAVRTLSVQFLTTDVRQTHKKNVSLFRSDEKTHNYNLSAEKSYRSLYQENTKPNPTQLHRREALLSS